MFTGLVEALGIVKSCSFLPKQKSLLFEIQASQLSDSLKIGGSLCVNGVCLTVAKKTRKNVFFNIVGETKKRSTLSELKKDDLVNLERPLKFKGRIEGHFVLGHVDGVGVIQRIETKGSEKSFLISFPTELKLYIFEKGSIAIDGVSLTLGKVSRNFFWVHGIPHTLKSTNFKNFRQKTRVNLETDILAKMTVKQKLKAH